MINSKEDLYLYLHQDWARNMHTDKYSYAKYLFELFKKSDHAFAYRVLKALRKYEYSLNCLNNKSIFGRVYRLCRQYIYRTMCVKYNVNISVNTTSPGLYLPHIVGGGIVLFSKSIGKNCVINTGVIIGKKDSEDETPIIGDNCEINANCVIFGNIRIGNNVKIGPNSVVYKDIPDNAVVSGVPSQIIKIKEIN